MKSRLKLSKPAAQTANCMKPRIAPRTDLRLRSPTVAKIPFSVRDSSSTMIGFALLRLTPLPKSRGQAPSTARILIGDPAS